MRNQETRNGNQGSTSLKDSTLGCPFAICHLNWYPIIEDPLCVLSVAPPLPGVRGFLSGSRHWQNKLDPPSESSPLHSTNKLSPLQGVFLQTSDSGKIKG